jgi:cyclophilin family peptidyl-prolyl cis-trans isomerase
MKRLLIFLLVLMVPVSFGQEKRKYFPGVYAHFETSMGNFVVQLFDRQVPMAAENFMGLAEGRKIKGKRFYDNTTFHRVIDGFMIQGGDPTGSGTGGPGYKFNDEIVRDLKHDREGRVSMANSGPNTNGSQFFITLGARSSLDGKYTIFGQVVDGMDVVKKIGKVPVVVPPRGREKSRPVMPVIVKHVTIERVK